MTINQGGAMDPSTHRKMSSHDPVHPPSPLNGRPQPGFTPLYLQEATPRVKVGWFKKFILARKSSVKPS